MHMHILYIVISIFASGRVSVVYWWTGRLVLQIRPDPHGLAGYYQTQKPGSVSRAIWRNIRF